MAGDDSIQHIMVSTQIDRYNRDEDSVNCKESSHNKPNIFLETLSSIAGQRDYGVMTVLGVVVVTHEHMGGQMLPI